jgi:prepilin-type N-terminal cleavage/methylation domain-containing protein
MNRQRVHTIATSGADSGSGRHVMIAGGMDPPHPAAGHLLPRSRGEGTMDGWQTLVPRRGGEGTSRRGLTIIELLVSISIMAVLMSLILPAVQNAREAARRTECLNNARNLSLALLNATEQKKRFPAAAYWGGPDKNRPGPHHNWVVEILSWIDRRDLADRWDHDQLLTHSANQAIAETHVRVLACPSDISTDGRGDLSYAVNGGIGESTLLGGVQDCIVDPFSLVLDLNGNGQVCVGSDTPDGSPSDRELFHRLGLFFNENWGFETSAGYRGTRRFHRPATVTDGLSNTLLLAENVRTGFAPNVPLSNWGSCNTRQTKVYFSHRICGNNVCAAGNVDFSRANSGEHAINAGRSQPEGMAPWPSSFHPGVVVVGFADGRAQVLSETVSGQVYFQLMTPQGTRLSGSPLDAGVLSDGEF